MSTRCASASFTILENEMVMIYYSAIANTLSTHQNSTKKIWIKIQNLESPFIQILFLKIFYL